MRIVARINHLHSGNVVDVLVNGYDYKQFLNRESLCDCCNLRRYRTVTYILEDEGHLLQVGNNCLDKMLGRDLTFTEDLFVHNYFDDGFFLCGQALEYFNVKKLINGILFKNPNLKLLKTSNMTHDFSGVGEHPEYNDCVNYLLNAEFTNEFTQNIQTILRDALEHQEGYAKTQFFNIMKYAVKVYRDGLLRRNAFNQEGLTSDTFTIKQIYLKEKTWTERGYHNYIDIFIYRAIDENNNLIEIRSTKDNLTELINKTVKCNILGNFVSKDGKVTKVNRIKEVK